MPGLFISAGSLLVWSGLPEYRQESGLVRGRELRSTVVLPLQEIQLFVAKALDFEFPARRAQELVVDQPPGFLAESDLHGFRVAFHACGQARL